MTTAFKTSLVEQPTQKQTDKRKWAKQTLNFVGTAILCVAALETIFYLAKAGESDHLMVDSYDGFKPIPNKRITYRKEGYSSVTYNSFGLQNDEITEGKQAGTYRVAVFGDSCVESLQVPREENYCSVLAKSLREKLQKPVEVMNFGVGNYSVAQDFIRYKTLARRFSPDLVILAYRVRETDKMLPDSTMNMVYNRPVFFNIDGRMTYDDTMIKQFAQTKQYRRLITSHWLRCYSRISGVLGQMNGSWMAFWKTKNTAPKWPFERTAKKADQPSYAAY